MLGSAVSHAVDMNDYLDVRVVLAQAGKPGEVAWKLHAPGGFVIANYHNAEVTESIRKKDITLSVKKGHLAINGKPLATDGVEIKPLKHKSTTYGGNMYAGSFLFLRFKKEFYLINMLPLEEYVFSVLRWEGWPGWPLEINRVLAIMCRTYVLAKLAEIRRHDGSRARRPYDIKATNMHQTYKGLHKFNGLRQAVEDTKGMVMTYAGKPIVAMYDICCGGVVPAHLAGGIDFKKAPYLAREHACTYCRSCKLYSWKLQYNLSDFHDIIKSGRYNAVPVKEINVSNIDKAGVVREVTIATNSTKLALTGQKIYSLCKDIKSLCFTVKKQGKKIIFNGKGWGHHLGLCQWGAREMVRQGWKCKEILRFFYPGVSFSHIELVQGDVCQDTKGT